MFIKRFFYLLSIVLLLTACGTNGDMSNNLDFNKVSRSHLKKGGTANLNIEKRVDNWNQLNGDGGVNDVLYITSIIYPSAYIIKPDSSVAVNTELLDSVNMTSVSPETIVYNIKKNAVWSDGVPITGDDFIYLWNMQNGNNSNISVQSTVGYEDIDSITQSNKGKTVTVVFKKPFAEWQALFSSLMPAHWAKSVNSDLVTGWNTDMETKLPTVSGGPFKITESSKNGDYIVLQKNDKWYGRSTFLDKLVFRYISDPNQSVLALRNHELNAIIIQGELDAYNNLKQNNEAKAQSVQGTDWEHIDLNLNDPIFADSNLRKSIFTAVNVDEYLNKTEKLIQKSAKRLNNRMLPMNSDYYQDNVEKKGFGNGNIDLAKKILTDNGYTGVGTNLTYNGKELPTLNMVYTVGNYFRQNICSIFKEQMSKLGIKVNINTTDSLGKTLTGSDPQHSYDVIVYAWVANSFPVSSNQSLYVSDGAQNYAHNKDQRIDDIYGNLLSMFNAPDSAKQLNQIDQYVTEDAFTIPLYNKSTIIALDKRYGNIAYGQPYTYNTQDWGMLK